MSRRVLQLWLCLAACGFLSAQTSPAPPREDLEYQVKAAFLLNFTRFVEWPDGAFSGPASPFAICVIGKDPFGEILDDTLAGEAVNGRKFVVRRFLDAPPPRACHVAYLVSPAKDSAKLIQDLGPAVLTVGEGEAFARDGGIIAFVLQDRRVRFDVNSAAASACGLRLSSKLLNVARIVRK